MAYTVSALDHGNLDEIARWGGAAQLGRYWMRFRPADDPRNTVDDIPGVTIDSSVPNTPVEWEDNWLSNSFAWASYFFIPAWCQTPEHFSSRLTQYLFTDCPCCLMWRGVTLGYVAGGLVGLVVGVGIGALL